MSMISSHAALIEDEDREVRFDEFLSEVSLNVRETNDQIWFQRRDLTHTAVDKGRHDRLFVSDSGSHRVSADTHDAIRFSEGAQKPVGSSVRQTIRCGPDFTESGLARWDASELVGTRWCTAGTVDGAIGGLECAVRILTQTDACVDGFGRRHAPHSIHLPPPPPGI